MIRALVTFAFLALASLPAAIDIQQITSPGGIQGVAGRDHSIPFTALTLMFPRRRQPDAPGSAVKST